MVPEGWAAKPVSEIASIKGGKRMPKGARFSDTPTPFPYIRVTDFVNGTIATDDIKYVLPEHQAKIARYTISKDDIYISIAGTLGIVGMVPAKLDGAQLTENAAKIGVHSDSPVTKEYLARVLQSEVGQSQISVKKGVGGGVPKLALFRIGEILVPLPPLNEQQRIAEILLTWDRAIETTEALLAAARTQKRALMQSVFSRESMNQVECRLDDLFEFKRGAGLSKGSLDAEGKNKCVLYGELYTMYDEVIHSTLSRTNESKGLGSVAGDILIPSSTTTTGIDLGNAVVVLEDNVLLGGDIIVLRPDLERICPIYLAHLLTYHKKHEIASMAQGITIIHVYGRDLKRIRVSFPDLVKQRQISKVLCTMDQERINLTAYLDKLKSEKKALMQQLLTGKRRVKIDGDVDRIIEEVAAHG